MDKGRGFFWASGSFFALFVADILIAKAQVLAGSTIPVHMGDTLQFIVLLVTVALFVAGALIRERHEGVGGERIVLPGEETASPGRP